MEIVFRYTDLLNIISFAVATTIGLLLILSSFRTNKANLILGVFMCIANFGLVDAFLQDTGIFEQYPRLIFIPTNCYFLFTPLLALYVARLIGKRMSFFLFIPFLLELIAFGVMFSLSPEEKWEIFISDKYGMYNTYFMLALVLFNAAVLLVILTHIRMHQSRALKEYSHREGVTLDWVRHFIYITLGFQAFFLLETCSDIFLTDSSFIPYMSDLASVFSLSLYIWIGYKGAKQPEIFLGELELKPPPLKQQVSKPKENLVEEFKEMQAFVMANKPFKNSKITLNELADQLNIHSKKLSKIINQETEKNFFQYINDLRLAEFKRSVSQQSIKEMTILGLALDAGFNSKSSFNSLFKKSEGITPSEWVKTNVTELVN